ncbi:Predicted member of the intramitochondrial sorting protein family [Phaffia rhodozyma]|uniref:Predicted member of the intramitochondrial sorting protein family n=1 Tax=Phaffia rhodozyma TaxID=264483 RepID=A0A0F7SIX9_PHARH|nr:Predicted member of the intramitochondrial sorting protein family [Phaffia rhodozyma]
MVQIFSQAFSFPHEWSKVVSGVWQKYPNPATAHVISVDTIGRTVDPATGVVRTERVIGCKQSAPRWAIKMLGGTEDAYVREVSFVDPVSQKMTMFSVNLSLSQYLTVLESITYSPSHSSPKSSTLFSQTAEISARGSLWKSVADKLETVSLERFVANAALGKEGFEGVLSKLWEKKDTESS